MSEPNTTSGPPAWVVTGQTERTIISDGGTAVNVVTVTFNLPNGTVGSVNIPLTGYNVDAVRQAIAARVALLNDVANLTG